MLGGTLRQLALVWRRVLAVVVVVPTGPALVNTFARSHPLHQVGRHLLDEFPQWAIGAVTIGMLVLFACYVRARARADEDWYASSSRG